MRSNTRALQQVVAMPVAYLCLLAGLVVSAALLANGHGIEYETVIAIYNTSNGTNVNCSRDANFHYSIDELPLANLTSNTLLRLCSPSFLLQRNLTLSGLSTIAFVGYYTIPVLKCPEGSSLGITLKNIKGLELHNFTVESCGVMTDIDSTPSHNIKASVTIEFTTNIMLSGIKVSSSPGSGLALFYNNGSITVENSVFERNGLDQKSGGNGVYLETGPPNYLFSGHDLTAFYTFTGCLFEYNSAVTGKDSIIKGFSRFDKGGGMCVYILASERLEIIISNSVFTANKVDHYGGGLFVSYIGKARNNTVQVKNTNFFNNSAIFAGGSYSGYLHTRVPVLETPLNCSYLYESVNFIGNEAQFGGGSSIFASKTLNNDSSAEVNFKNCSWSTNVGQYGAAVAVLPNAWNLYTEGYLPTPRFFNCTFTSNHVRSNNKTEKGDYTQYSKGSGAFYCFGHNVLFEEKIVFEKNIGSAMYLGSCLVIFQKHSVTLFMNNTGYQGGAIYELSSVVYLHNNASLYFVGNRADDKGGAVYEHTFFMHIYDYSKTCFIDYIDDIIDVAKRNISVGFVDNFAVRYGHSIYASSLRPCYNRFSFSASNLSIDIFDQVGNFSYYPPGRHMEIATAVNHSDISAKWSGHLFAIAGKEVQIPFEDVDDLNQTVQTSYLVTIDNNALANISTNKDDLEISSNSLVLYGEGNGSAIVTLSDTSSRQIALSFKVTLQACPPGFVHGNQPQVSCICSVDTGEAYTGIEACNLTLTRAHIKEGYWAGYLQNETENENSLVSGYCPAGFCSIGENSLLPGKADREELNNVVCSKSRTGILCGRCKQNYSVHFHSLEFRCKANKYCNIGWLFYILSEIVPITIIFLVIILFNISFTSGLVNGFILYCQVVEVFQLISNDLIPFSDFAVLVNKIHSLLYLSSSLNLFILDELSFCLWENASAVAMVAFTFVTLIYAFSLVLLVTFIVSKCSMRCNVLHKIYRYIPVSMKPLSPHRGIIHGLSAFLILCYAQCARSCFLLLISATIYNKGSTQHRTMVYYAGEIEWMGMEHLPYAIPAILLAFVLLVLPPLLLLIYPLHNKVLSLLRISETQCVRIVFSPLDKLKPFFDSFQSCFKDEFRFFSGLYFVYRFFIMFNVVINYLQDSFFFLEIQLVSMLVIHAVCQPYKKRLHNVIDTLLFGNLAAINAITYYNINSAFSAGVSALNHTGTIWLQILLIILPLPIMAVILLSRTYCVRKCVKRSHTKLFGVEGEVEELPDRINYDPID